MQRGTDCDLLWKALECPLRLKHEQTQLLELVGRKDSHSDGEGGEAPVSKALLGMLSTGLSLSVVGRYWRVGV